MLIALSIGTLLAALALLWSGVKKLRWSAPASALLSVLDLIGIAALVISLGWIGLALFVTANVLAFIGWGVAGSIYVDSELAAAAAHSGTVEKADMRGALQALDREKQLTALGPRRRARLVRLLADRSRSPIEIEAMGVPIGMLYLIGEPRSIDWLVERFDSILRLYGKEPAGSMDVADTLTASSQRSAATLEETIEALVVAGGGSESDPPVTN